MPWLKRVLLFVSALVALLVVGLVLFVVTFDPNAHRERITAAVEQGLGRSFRLTGQVELSLYPWVGVVADGIEIGNAAGFGPEPFLKANRVAVRARLLPLLRSRLELDTVRLDGAVINLAVDEAGVSNWQDLTGATPAAASGAGAPAPTPAAAPTPTTGAALPFAVIAIGGAEITNLELTFDDRQQQRRFVLSGFAVRTGALAAGEPVPLTAGGHIEASQPALSGDFSLQGTVLHDLAAQRFELRPLNFGIDLAGEQLPEGRARIDAEANIVAADGGQRIEITGLKVSGLEHSLDAEVTAGLREGEAPAVSGRLTAAGPDLAVLFRAFADPELAADLARLPERAFEAQLAADIDPRAGRFDVPQFSLRMLGARIEGKAAQTGAVIGADLNAQGPDLPALLRAVGAAGLAGELPVAAIGGVLAKQDVPRPFNVASQLSIERNGTALTVPHLNAELLGAKFTVSDLAVAGLDRDAPVVKGAVSAEGSHLSALLAVAGALSGRPDDPLAQAAASLAAGGDSPFAAKGILDLAPAEARFGVKELDLRLPGISAGGSVTGDDDALTGTLTVTGERPQRLLAAFGQAELGERLERFTLNLPVQREGARVRVSPLRLQAGLAAPRAGQGPLELGLSANLAADTVAGDYQIDDLSLSGLGMNITGALEAAGVGQGTLGLKSLEARLDAPVFNLREVLGTLGQGLPPMADAKALTAVGLSFAARTVGESVEVTDLALSLDGARITGNMALRRLQGPDASFRLAADRLDVDRYLPPGERAAATPEAAAAGAATEIPIEDLRGLVLDGEARIGQLRVSGLSLSEVVLSIKAGDGRIVAEPLTAKLYEGRYEGKIAIDATGDVPVLGIDSRLTGVQAEPLLQDLQGKSRLRGRGDVTLALTARGATTEALTRSLTGEIRIDFRDGAIKGVNIGKLLRAFQSGTFTGVAEETTDFAALGGTIRCTQGVCANDDLTLMSPLLRVSGQGTVVNLVNDTIDYHLRATLVGTAEGQGGRELALLDGVPIPIHVKGRPAEPRYVVDFGSLLKEKATDELKQQLGRKLGIGTLGGAAAAGAAAAGAAALLGGPDRPPAPAAAPAVEVAPITQPAAAVPAVPAVDAVPEAEPAAVVPAVPAVEAVPEAEPAAVVPAVPAVEAVPEAGPAAVVPAAPAIEAEPTAPPAAVVPAAPTVEAEPVAEPATAAPAAPAVEAVPEGTAPSAGETPAVEPAAPVADPGASPPAPETPEEAAKRAVEQGLRKLLGN